MRSVPTGGHEADLRASAPLRSWLSLPGVLLALALPVVGFTWLAGEQPVTLLVDGETERVRTHAGSVGELLERAGVELAPADAVIPPPETDVASGMIVEVIRAREAVVVIGGERRRARVPARDVGELLSHLEAGVGRRAAVRPSRLSRVSSGMVVEVHRPVDVTVVHRGTARQVRTKAPTVGALLDRLGMPAVGDVRVSPAPETPLELGTTVVVRHVERVEETRTEAVPFPTVERETDALPRGERRRAAPGREGLREIVEEVVRVDGVAKSRTRIAERTVREPEPRIIEVGTAPPPSPTPTPARADPESDAGAREQAESANTQEGDASWYDHPGSEPYTAAHRTIPFGTVVTVTNLSNGRTVEVRINDRGPFVEGRIIDLNRPAFREIAPVGSGVIPVRLEW